MKDLIERQTAIEAVRKHEVELTAYTPKETDIFWDDAIDCCIDELEQLPSAQPEQYTVDDLISFIEREKDKENRTLGDWVVQWILEKIINGECKITGSATDHKEKKMYVEFSFYQEK